MALKTLKPKTNQQPTGHTIPELTNLQAYNLINALEHAQCAHVNRIYITDAGYFFSEGNSLTEMIDLDPKVPGEAALIKVGKKQKRVLLPGKYIGRKQVIKEYTREEVLESKVNITSAYAAEQKVLKAKQKVEKGDDEDSPVKVITEALQKLKSNG